MRPLTYYVGATIDGYIAAPDGDVDVFDPGEDVLAWITEEHADLLPTAVRDALGLDDSTVEFDTVVMGRRTYEPALLAGCTSPYRHLDQHVVSTTLAGDLDPTVHIVREDPLGLVRTLKASPGKGIFLAGGGVLAGQLLPAIDRIILKTYPLVIGSGVPVIATGFADVGLRLIGTRTFASGAVATTYERDVVTAHAEAA
jgi:dihydrofolate reductase